MRLCQAQGCNQPARNFGSYCRHHDTRNAQTGDPNGITIKERDTRTLRRLSERMIRHHQDHPGVKSALEFLRSLTEVASTKAPAHIHANSSPADRLDRWLSQMHKSSVTPEDMLAMVVAMYALREDRPGLFRSDRHFNHQLAIRFLRLTPAPFAGERWCAGTARRKYDRISVGTRELLATILIGALESLPIRMAEQVLKATKPKPRDRLQGIDFPFNAKGSYS